MALTFCILNSHTFEHLLLLLSAYNKKNIIYDLILKKKEQKIEYEKKGIALTGELF